MNPICEGCWTRVENPSFADITPPSVRREKTFEHRRL
jgi:hypothetical protein